MVNAVQAAAAPKIRCRQIADGDLDGLADLLKRGFGSRRTHAFWRHALACLRARAVPAGMPRYGYLLENDGAAVGAILLIFATTPGSGDVRANVSSWYVEPAFRSYAPLLVSQALKLKQITYLNISAVRHTWPIVEAQGYKRYSNGVFVALPALQRAGRPRPAGARGGRPAGRAARTVRARPAGRARRLRLHQLLVRDARARVSVRVSAAHRQERHPVRAADLLRRRRRRRAVRRTDRAIPGVARPPVRRHRRERADQRASPADISPTPCRNSIAAPSARGSATSPTRKPRCSGCDGAGSPRRPALAASLTRKYSIAYNKLAYYIEPAGRNPWRRLATIENWLLQSMM